MVVLAMLATLAWFGMHLPEQHGPTGPQFVMNEQAAVEFMGPTLEAGAIQDEAYVPLYIPKTTTVATPAPTPAPYYIYCNDGGQYYHMRSCSFVKATTPKATIIQAVKQGYKRCKQCKPPTLRELYGDTLDSNLLT